MPIHNRGCKGRVADKRPHIKHAYFRRVLEYLKTKKVFFDKHFKSESNELNSC
jgi:hypothetical protein